MNSSHELALKLNHLILSEPLIQEFQKLDNLVGKEVANDDKKIRALQKQMSEHLGQSDFEQYRQNYLQAKEEFDQNPLYVNYLSCKKEVNEMLLQIQEIINKSL